MSVEPVRMRRVLLIVAVVLVVAGSSYGVSRMVINDAVAAAKPLADERNAQREQMLKAEQQQMMLHARQDTLTTLLARLEEKLQQSPTDSMLLISAGNIAYDLQQYGQAEKHYETFLRSYKVNQNAVRIDYGFTVFQNGKQQEGIGILRHVLRSEPTNQTALFNLAYMFQQQGNTDSTKALLTACMNSDPTSAIGKNAAAVLEQLASTSTNKQN